METNILVVDDEREIAELVEIYLVSDGYKVFKASNAQEGFDILEKEDIHLVLLDIMMPGMDGVSVLKALFHTARSEVSQRVEGLDAGADDYLPKPFSTAELLARVRAMLRRKDNYLPDLLCLGPVTLNRSTYQLGYDGQEQTLSGKEFQLLEMMMQTPGTIIATDRFITHLWGWDTTVDTSVVWVHISNLRKKINAVGAPLDIRFVRGVGYTLEVRA